MQSFSKRNNLVVFQSDFGTGSSAVASMYGVAESVSGDLKLYDLTHSIPVFDIWVAALTLSEAMVYWPAGTVFVSVVDPGVGTDRLSVAVKTKTGHYIVTPDNGTLTFITDKYGIIERRQIDEAVNRRANSEKSYTFHGRDVYAYVAARLASDAITFEQVGALLEPTPVQLIYTRPSKSEDNSFEGTVVLIDKPYGNVWTNIDRDLFVSSGIKQGDMIRVSISHGNQLVYQGEMPYVATFAEVEKHRSLLYINSQYAVSLALNTGDFATSHGVDYGQQWSIKVCAVS